MNDIIWLTMRRMRAPLIVVVLVFSVSIIGMVLIPGRDASGNVIEVKYLDAAYFILILATTIGLGEIPAAFTGLQRFYVFIIVLPNVVAWLYSVGTILGMFLDPQFRQVLKRERFSHRVRAMPQGFFIVCGFGNTGRMIVHALLRRGYSTVVLERDEDIVNSMALDDAIAHVPVLAGSSSERETLELAGLKHKHCLGVLAITDDDHVNLTIAITCKMLNPDLLVIARSENDRVSANMASFGTDHVLDPYAIFAERLYLAFSSPAKYLVQDWLISVPGSELRKPFHLPHGQWLLCGFGRFGSRVARAMDQASIPYTIIDVHPARVQGKPGAVLGRGTEVESLLAAGINDAAGIVAGTGDDIDNLSIMMTARDLNPRLCFIARQERVQNEELFNESRADLVARRSLIMARRILLVATTPLLQSFLQHLLGQGDAFAQRVTARLQAVLKGRAPDVWTVHLEGRMSTGLVEASRQGVHPALAHILRHSRTAEAEHLPCVCLLLERGASRTFMPDPMQELHVEDRLLFAGRDEARREIAWTLSEPHALLANASGRIVPRGTLWRWLERRHQPD